VAIQFNLDVIRSSVTHSSICTLLCFQNLIVVFEEHYYVAIVSSYISLTELWSVN